MKRTAKKLISLLLALCLLAALSVSAFAETKKFDSYLMIGDSIAVYCGEPDGTAKSTIYSIYDKNPKQAFLGTYSELLKNELGITDICCCAHPGWRAQEALFALGGNDYTTDYILQYGGDSVKRITRFLPTYASALENANLITVNLGANNIIEAFVYGLYTAFEMEDENIPFTGSEQDVQILEYLNRLKADVGDTEALVNLIVALEYTERGTVLLKNALKMLPEAISGFEKSMEELMALIYEKNPDADVLVLGLYNPVGYLVDYTVNSKLSPGEAGQKLSDATALLLEQAAEPVVSAMNLYLRCGCSYSGKYVYVDVSGVDLTGSKDGVHLGAVGQQYFCSQLLTAINNNFVVDSVPATRTVSVLRRLLGNLIKR